MKLVDNPIKIELTENRVNPKIITEIGLCLSKYRPLGYCEIKLNTKNSAIINPTEDSFWELCFKNIGKIGETAIAPKNCMNTAIDNTITTFLILGNDRIFTKVKISSIWQFNFITITHHY